jgi:hypothetical protein
MKKTIRYNIRLNVKTLKSIFEYFGMNKDNTIIELITTNEKTREALKEYKSNILKETKTSVYLKNMKFEQLYYFLNKYLVFNINYFKTKETDVKKLTHKFKNNPSEVCVGLKMDAVHQICFDTNKYDYDKTKEFLKKYRTINIEYIILFILLIVGILIRLLR